MGTDAYISAAGAAARLQDLDVVANNMANVGSPGFKRNHSVFKAVLEGRLHDEAGRPAAGAPARAFVRTDLVGIDFAKGPVEHTGVPLHTMIDGPGFFEIETRRGLRYTRAGNFRVNLERQLSTPDGAPVLGEGGPITITDTRAIIDSEGVVQDGNGNVLGRLKVVEFGESQSLENDGLTLFRPELEAMPVPVTAPKFIPESVEGSNVETPRELADMVILQRAFETNLRAMQLDDEMTRHLIEGIR